MGPTILDSAYLDPMTLSAEVRGIFARSWLLVGRSDEIIEFGSYFTWERTRVPMVMIRAADGVLRGFYNSCRHRGAPVVRTKTGKARAFRCQYHSWTYDTFGKLMAVPDERDFGDLDRCSYSLIPLRVAEVGGWLWVTQDKTSSALVPQFEPAVSELLEASASPVMVDRTVVTLASNWKAVVERGAEVCAGAESGALANLLLPNTYVIRRDDGVTMVSAWPVDERTTELEIMHAASAGTSADTYASFALELASKLDGIPLSGVIGSASERTSHALAALISEVGVKPSVKTADAI